MIDIQAIIIRLRFCNFNFFLHFSITRLISAIPIDFMRPTQAHFWNRIKVNLIKKIRNNSWINVGSIPKFLIQHMLTHELK